MPSHSKKQKKEKSAKDKEEEALEKLLFGDLDDSVWDKIGRETDTAVDQEIEHDSSKEEEEEEGDKEPIFFVDTSPGFVIDTQPTPMAQSDVDMSSDEDSDQDESDAEASDNEQPEYNVKSAWTDEDDVRMQISLKSTDRLRKLRKTEEEDVINGADYERRLRKQMASLYPKPQWAMLPSEKHLLSRKRRHDDDDESDADESDTDQLDNDDRISLLKSTFGIVESRKTLGKIQPDFIDITRMNDANQTSRSSGVISALSFHPNANVLMVGSLDKSLRLFQIDGKVNTKIQSFHFKDTPIHSAAFHPSGDQIILTGRRKHYYIYDVQAGAIEKCSGIWGSSAKSLENFSMSPCGSYMAFLGTGGNITVVSHQTKQWIGNLKMSNDVRSVDWSPDGKYLFGIGQAGPVHQFDVGQRRCVKNWVDPDSYSPRTLAVSPTMNYIATGLDSGIVNLYDKSVTEVDNHSKPKPVLSIDNLVTSISDIKFSHDAQVMAIASDKKQNMLRLAHLPTGRVFGNWPTERTPLRYVTKLGFSADSSYLAIGNAEGRVLLYAMKHYIH